MTQDAAKERILTTGIDLQAAISFWEKQRDLAKDEFPDSFSAFPDETKASPDDVMARYLRAEEAVVQLQTALAEYNQLVSVEIDGRRMSLTEAIKRVGGAGRVESLWRDATKSKSNPYQDNSSRDEGKTYAVAALPLSAIQERVTLATKWAAQLRRQISAANAQRVEVVLDPKLLSEAL